MRDIKLTIQSLFELSGDIFDSNHSFKLYDCQIAPLKSSFNIKSNSDEDITVHVRVENKNGSKVELVDSNGNAQQQISIHLQARVINVVNILIHPSESNEEAEPRFIATADFSSSITKRITINTKRSRTPVPKFSFDFLNDDNKYFIGEGKIKIGTLKIIVDANDKGPRYAYKPLDLSGLTSSCERIEIDLSQNIEDNVIYPEEQKTYDVYFSTDEADDYEFRFLLGTEKSNTYTVNAKKLRDPLEDFSFITRPELRFDELKKDSIIGYLSTRFKQNQRGYFARNNGTIELTDRIYSFDKEGKKTKLKLEFGKHEYPIYVNVDELFGGKRDNIDADTEHEINVLYSDSSIHNKSIKAKYTVQHIPAHPSSKVYILNTSNTVIPISNQTNITLQEWKYDSIHASQVVSATIFTLCLCNDQRVPYNDNGILWQDIDISGEDIIPQNISSKEIRNGKDEVRIPIKVKFAELQNKSEINVNISYKEIIIDSDTDEANVIQINTSVTIPMSEIVVDDWYSIDLGTTGIVVAKWSSAYLDNNGITTVNLEDQGEESIETSRDIVSSITILKESSDNPKIAEVVVAPSITGLKLAAKFVLVPTKFMVGQKAIPFIKEYVSKFPDGVILGDKKHSWDDITPQDILTYTYKTIFSRISSDECKLIRKLIITYPNTYTPKSLDWLRDMIIRSGIFTNLSERNLHFIPESDSVVAFYINKSMQRTTSTPSERVVIYDMGAGTLDLSYVKISIEEECGRRVKKSIIDRRIGLPIAGEYFSYLIYDQYKDKIQGGTANYTIKTWVEAFKAKYGSETVSRLRDISDDESVINLEYIDECISLNEQTEKWIDLCTRGALVQLLGEEWYNEVDRIVLSGRGSQFLPIRSILEALSHRYDIEFDMNTIQTNELKQCVAEGAILYQKIFENPSMPFTIIHKNSYERIGIKYRILDEYFTQKWAYKELMNESHLIWEESPKDGAIFAQVPYREIYNLDFTLDEDVVFYLTTLNADQMDKVINNPGTEEEAFIHELFRFKPRVLTCAGDDRTHCMLSLSINSNNDLSVSIYSMDLLPHSTLPNVEDDKFYVKCNWYFN